MNKFFKSTIICIVICLFAGCFFACIPGDGIGGKGTAGNSKPIKFGAKLLQDCRVVLDDNDKSLAVEVKTSESVTTNNKGYLVSFDENNKLRQVVFIYEHVKTTTSAGLGGVTEEIEITQEEIEASVSNLFVTKKFTYITFTPRGYTDNTSNKFTSSASFTCDDYHQSFVIYNETGKVYPTNEIGAFSNIKENYIYVGGTQYYDGSYTGGKFYQLSVDAENNLKSKKLVPNDNISEYNVLVDKFGQTFVLNSLANEVKDNIVYYTSAANQKYLGDDGFVYEIETVDRGSEIYNIRYYDNNLRLKTLASGTNVSLGGILIKNNRFFYLSSSSWLYHLNIITGKTISIFESGGLKNAYTFDTNKTFVIAGREIFEYHLVGGVKTLFYFDCATVSSAAQVTTFTDLEVSGSSLILTKETLDGTQKREVRVNNGQISLELLLDITYTNKIITIQPLN